MPASSSTKAVTLPFRLELTPAARQKEKLYVTAGVLFVGAIAGILAGALAYVLFKVIAALIAIVFVLPEGLVGGVRRFLAWIGRRSSAKGRPPTHPIPDDSQ